MGTIPFHDGCRRLRLLALLALCLTGLAPPPTGAETLVNHATPVEITECGQVVLSDAVLVADLVCETREFEWAAIEVGASNITVDLGGHVVFGQPAGSIGIRADGFDGVTIKNGTVDGFIVGITFADSRDATVEDVTIRNLESDDPEEWVTALWVNGSHDALVRDSFFEFLPVVHKNGLQMDRTAFTADGVEMIAGSVGVDINFGSTGSVINSRFVGTVISGVLIQNSAYARVAENEFASNADGVTVNPHDPDGVTGLTIEGNSIHDGGNVAIHFLGNSGCSILNNVIRDNWRGIALESNMECLDGIPRPDCYYSTGNVIADNEVVDNHLDLYHHEHAVGNIWLRNTCDTKEGAEIPVCSRPPRRGAHRLPPVRPRP